MGHEPVASVPILPQRISARHAQDSDEETYKRARNLGREFVVVRNEELFQSSLVGIARMHGDKRSSRLTAGSMRIPASGPGRGRHGGDRRLSGVYAQHYDRGSIALNDLP
jgi:hypothetical protein